MELIYTYISQMKERNISFNDGINYSNEFTVELISEDSCIKGIDICREKNAYIDLYPSCIKNINLLIGINGAGKTSVLDLLGSTRHKRKSQWDKWIYFSIYHINDEEYVIEGNNLYIIEDVLTFEHESIKKNTNSIEYSLKCKYDSNNKKMHVIDLCSAGEWDRGTFLYYKDLSEKKYSWTLKENNPIEDHEIFLKREIVFPQLKGICDFLKYAKTYDLFENKNFQSMPIIISLNEAYEFECDWENIDGISLKKTFVLLVSFYLIKYLSNYKCISNNIYEKIEIIEQKMKGGEYIYEDGWTESLQQILRGVIQDEEQKLGSSIKTDLIKAIIDLDDEFFYNGVAVEPLGAVSHPSNMIRFHIEDLERRGLENLINLMNTVNNDLGYLFQIKIDNLNAGHMQLIDVFSSTFSKIEESRKHYIFLLDEPEKGMHPEMSRNFINNLVSYAEKVYGEKEYTFQFIITTHSPFMVSDVPVKNVHCLSSDDGVFKIRTTDIGLLCNIPDIMKNNFFLGSPFGIWANKYFEKLQDCIKKLDENPNMEDEIDRLTLIIENVNEPVVKKFLKNKLDEELYKIANDNITEKEKLIMYYESKINELKGM